MAVSSDTADDATRHARAAAWVAGPPTRAIAFDAHARIAQTHFLEAVRGVAATLPEAGFAINLCVDRYRFLVAFCAAAVRGQVTLLPPARTLAAIADVAARYPDHYGIGEPHGDDTLLPTMSALARWHALPDPLPQAAGAPPCIDETALALIAFTSGSTGAPKANPKTWHSLRISTAQNAAALRGFWPSAGPLDIVATVPPQHMYGMELSVLLPLFADAAVHGGRPFFAEDVARALRESAAPALLVTTPVHLRALVEANIALPPLAGIVTATAPLPQALAAAAEARFACAVLELFGATEVCIFAQRRTAHEDLWSLYPDVQLSPQADGTQVSAAHLPAPVMLADVLEPLPEGRFALRGRQADLLEIAGKRASLGDLTRRLLAIPGVIDGAMLQLDDADAGGVRRIAAVVVAPTLDEAAILAALRESVDPVFLPRPLRCVDALPRNDTGKLPRAALLALLRRD